MVGVGELGEDQEIFEVLIGALPVGEEEDVTGVGGGGGVEQFVDWGWW